MRLCKYKHVLGMPKKGIHSIRVGGVSIVDVILTVVGAFMISRASGWPFVNVTVILFLVGIFLHWLFCVPTTIGMALGLA
jgi:hypothetical protein